MQRLSHTLDILKKICLGVHISANQKLSRRFSCLFYMNLIGNSCISEIVQFFHEIISTVFIQFIIVFEEKLFYSYKKYLKICYANIRALRGGDFQK